MCSSALFLVTIPTTKPTSKPHNPHIPRIDCFTDNLTILKMLYSISFGPVGWVLPSELYSTEIRAKAMATTVAVNWGSNLGVSLTFLLIGDYLGPVRSIIF